MNLLNKKIGITYKEGLEYPKFPYCPDRLYPELSRLKNRRTDSGNLLYGKFRETLFCLELDTDNFGTDKWNPFKDFVKPGDAIMVKPNWVMHSNPTSGDVSSLITHSSFIKMAIDYVIIALSSRGKIVIADAPLQACDFKKLMSVTRINELIKLYKNKYPKIIFQILDLRKTIFCKTSDEQQIQLNKRGDPRGYSLVNLKKKSLLTDLDHKADKFRVTMYDPLLMHQHHQENNHEYLIANSVLSADAIINIPKMKCHIKSGLTGALKNAIGINGHKEFLPHHMIGSFFEGGDQYLYKNYLKSLFNKIYDRYWSKKRHETKEIKKIEGILLKLLAILAVFFGKDDLFEGGWFGNETIPRTTIDLNHILYFFNLKKKKIGKKLARNVISIVDGIVAGEGDGPLHPIAKQVGIILAGINPLVVDLVLAQMIGYNPLEVKTLFYGLYHRKSKFGKDLPDVDKFEIMLNKKGVRFSDLPNLNFIKPKYWRNINR